MLASVAEQASLSLTSSEPPEDMFSHGEAYIQYIMTIIILKIGSLYAYLVINLIILWYE